MPPPKPLADVDVGAGREGVDVVAIAAAVIEPRIAVDDDRGNVVAMRQRVADSSRPVVRLALLESELERVEGAVERGAELRRLVLVELLERRAARLGRHQLSVGSNTFTPRRVMRPVAGLIGPSLMSIAQVLFLPRLPT
jgi:hypothetical protein